MLKHICYFFAFGKPADWFQAAGLNLLADFRVLSSTLGGLGGSDYGFVQNPSNFRVTTASSFDLSSIQLGGAFSSSGTVTITGTLAAGGTLNEVATIVANTYTDVNFPATWTGLSQVDFVYSSNFLAIDNVVTVVSAAPPAIIPSLSVWMVLVLSILLGLLTFRKLNFKF